MDILLLVIVSYDDYFPSRASALFPTTIDQLKDLNMMLKDVKDEQFALILIGFCAVYIFKQSFAIPGSVIMVMMK